jgi:hypothetical protein
VLWEAEGGCAAGRFVGDGDAELDENSRMTGLAITDAHCFPLGGSRLRESGFMSGFGGVAFDLGTLCGFFFADFDDSGD